MEKDKIIFPDFLDTNDKWNICVWNTKTVLDFENLLQKILKIENITVRDFYVLMKHLERDLNLCHQTQEFSSSVELVDLLVNLFYVFSTINTDPTQLNQVIEQVISQINPVQLLGEDFAKKNSVDSVNQQAEESVDQIVEEKKVFQDSVDQVISQVILDSSSSPTQIENFDYQETDEEFFDESFENIKVEKTKKAQKKKRGRKNKSENQSTKKRKDDQS